MNQRLQNLLMYFIPDGQELTSDGFFECLENGAGEYDWGKQVFQALEGLKQQADTDQWATLEMNDGIVLAFKEHAIKGDAIDHALATTKNIGRSQGDMEVEDTLEKYGRFHIEDYSVHLICVKGGLREQADTDEKLLNKVAGRIAGNNYGDIESNSDGQALRQIADLLLKSGHLSKDSNGDLRD